MHHILDHWSGGDGQFLYDLYSGLGALILGAGFWANWWHNVRRHNCRHPGCWRISRHTITDEQGVTHGACGRHRGHVLAKVSSQ